MELPGPLIQALQQIVNARIRDDLDLQHGLKKIENKSVTLHFTGLELKLHFFIHENNIEILNQYDGTLDAEISIAPITFLSLINHPNTVEKQVLDISGDEVLARSFLNLLPLLKIDWEKQLGKITGGVIATQVGSQFRQYKQEQNRNWQSMKSNVSEYLQEETQLLPSKQEFDELTESNEQLRLKLKDLEQRVNSLNNN